MARVLVAMSGGVDSSVAAYLLKEAGHDCVGVTMRLYDNALLDMEGESTCCSVDDVEDARSVCAGIGIPFLTLDLSRQFREQVIERFVSAYERGSTPNPCIDCNRFMKFDLLLSRAGELGCDMIATGHYARVVRTGTGVELRRAADGSKDQSYVLAQIPASVLERTIFPLGELTKERVREIAESRGFINAGKRDSQDICFVPNGDYLDFIRRYTGKEPREGDILDTGGRVLGRHRGAAGYTVGQRRGLGVAATRPLYVKSKDMAANTVTVGYEEDLYSSSCTVGDFNWITRPEAFPVKCSARTRYRQREEPCLARILEDGGVELTFARPQRAVTRGQAAVLYDGDRVLGGGTIIGTQTGS